MVSLIKGYFHKNAQIGVTVTEYLRLKGQTIIVILMMKKPSKVNLMMKKPSKVKIRKVNNFISIQLLFILWLPCAKNCCK